MQHRYGRLSNACVVLATPGGVSAPAFDGEPSIDLDLDGLLLLEELGRAEVVDLHTAVRSVAVNVAGVEVLEELLARLEAGALMLPVEGSGAAAPAVPPTPAREEFGELTGSADQLVRIDLPLVGRITPDGIELVDHDGARRAVFSAREFMATCEFGSPTTVEMALLAHRRTVGERALRAPSFQAMVDRLQVAGVVHVTHADDAVPTLGELQKRLFSQTWQAQIELVRVSGEDLDAHDAAERARVATTGQHRVRVVPVAYNGHLPPLALGMIFAYAIAYDGGRLVDHYDFVPTWALDDDLVERVVDQPAIYFVSNYLWSHERCAAVSVRAKQANPHSIVVHGGPNTPKYPGDVEAYFRDHPDVDVTVRGEGEATAAEMLAALVGQLGPDHDGPPDLSVLADVPGLSYRDGDKVVRTADRDRIADLDTIPSPYLTGLFDLYAKVPHVSATIETNRGCPYGCTFCDWGSATLSRIRKFDIERVYAELEWCASAHIKTIGLADANFGIWERDVDITQRLADLKAVHGYPRLFGSNYAKNTVKHLRRIIEILVDAGILTHGVLSLQSMDEGTLETIKRSNIRLDKYEDLATQFRHADLPLYVDLMLGLPGSTVASFNNDLQACIDREVQANVHPTELLINSPMNEPAYREHNKIEIDVVGTNKLVVASSTFTREDRAFMGDMRRVFLLCEDFGVLRHLARYVRHETGMREIDFYARLLLDARGDRERWPAIAFTLEQAPDAMTAPVSWKLLFDDLHRYLVEELRIPDDDALGTALTVQLALLPASERQFPLCLELAHDYAQWHRIVIETKDAGHRMDWHDHVAALRTFPPAPFVVDDPDGVSRLAAGQNLDLHGFGFNWELESPVRRRVDNWVNDLLYV